MADFHAGVFHDSSVYTSEQLAKMLNRSHDWVKQWLDDESIPYRRCGNTRMVSGLAIRMWCEATESIAGV